MSKETMKLALEGAANYIDALGGDSRKYRQALAEQPAQQQELQTCNCRWEGEVQVQQCTLHEAHVDAIHEWAERAKSAENQFKNFHRLLCERFGYAHDERDWQRDQLSLIEWIAKRAEQPAQQQPVAWLEILRNNKTATDEVIGAFLRGHAEHLTRETFVLSTPAAPQPVQPQQEPVAWPIDGDTARRIADKVCVSYETVQQVARELVAMQPAQPQQEPLTDSQIMASIGRHWGGEKTSISQSRPVGQQWEQICELVRCVIRERYTSQPAQRKPLTDEQIDAAVKAWFENDIVAGRQPFAKRMRAAIEATHSIKGGA